MIRKYYYYTICMCINNFSYFKNCSDKKMNIVDAQNAALSGGVAVGAISHLMLQPYGAILIGSVSGIISTVGYQIIQVRKYIL